MVVLPYAGGFSIEGAETGVLLIHGFAGAPQNVWPVAEVLWRRGFAVHAPRLPGHGTSVDDLAETRPADWVEEAERGLEKLRSECDQIVVAGISLGGTIATHIAIEHNPVSALVAMSAPLFRLDALQAVLNAEDAPARIPVDARDAVRDRSNGIISYDEFPVEAFRPALQFAEEVGNRLDQISCPSLFMYGAHDSLVNADQGREAAERVTGSSFLMLEHSSHEITLDYERELVAGRTVEFIEKHTEF